MIEFDRRRAMIGSAGLAVGGMATARLLPEEMLLRDRRPARSRVAILSEASYSEGLIDSLVRALRLFQLSLHHKSVLLKPNLVDYIPGNAINTSGNISAAFSHEMMPGTPFLSMYRPISAHQMS